MLDTTLRKKLWQRLQDLKADEAAASIKPTAGGEMRAYACFHKIN